ncbi:hypothetical protein CWC29_022640 [Pseudoalteromonas sp. S4498]|uniref:hypothetical protein n=1 Tax=Pseudoalteromonas galatheae TaxID=579562 RepID=UPI00110842AE|nr:hypothetical protein [Pseudoalteromonas galatheae]NKC21578.1 hypothetical protein [Pseudoalteromonas galatheae]
MTSEFSVTNIYFPIKEMVEEMRKILGTSSTQFKVNNTHDLEPNISTFISNCDSLLNLTKEKNEVYTIDEEACTIDEFFKTVESLADEATKLHGDLDAFNKHDTSKEQNINPNISKIQSNLIHLHRALKLEKEFIDSKGDIEKSEKALEALKLKVKNALERAERMSEVCRTRTDELSKYAESSLQQRAEEVKELNNKISSISSSIEDIDEEKERALKDIKDSVANATKNLKDKEVEVNRFLESISQKLTATEFANSSEREKRAADRTRNLALVCMFLVIATILFVLYESFSDTSWHSTTLKAILIFSLSVPAVYLSRESSRHRIKQYEDGLTAFQLSALPSYVANLPPETQTEIKKEVANKIFKPNNIEISSESHPINVHEILLELVKNYKTKKN